DRVGRPRHGCVVRVRDLRPRPELHPRGEAHRVDRREGRLLPTVRRVMPPGPIVARPALPREWRELGRVLGEAFDDDPVWIWGCPAPVRRRRHLGNAFAHVIRDRVRCGWAWTVEGADGAAVWAAPNRWRTRPVHAARMALPMLRATGLRGVGERLGALARLEKR